jgi:SAM-dependent methyltransferase
MAHQSSFYEVHVLPYLLDFACGLKPITNRRRAVVPRAAGRVLEIGIGTGLNLAHYDRSKVTHLVGIDQASQMHRLAQRRSTLARLPVDVRTLSAEKLPFPDASFDCVVCTYTLCSVSDPAAALAEVHRVLRPSGKLLFAEHGIAPDESVRRWQRRLEPGWSRIAGGCHLTRDVPKLLSHARFAVSSDAGYVAWPKSLAYNFWGEATRL